MVRGLRARKGAENSGAPTKVSCHHSPGQVSPGNSYGGGGRCGESDVVGGVTGTAHTKG